MPKRSNQFQRLIYLLERELRAGWTVEESGMLTDRSGGEDLEVDVLVTAVVEGRPFRVAVECRDHKRKAPRTWIETIQGRFMSVDVNARFAVARKGFTPGAIKKARYLGIRLLSYSDAQRFPWAETINRMARVDFSGITFRTLQVNFEIEGTKGARVTTRPDLCRLTGGALTKARVDWWVNGMLADQENRQRLEAAARADSLKRVWASTSLPGHLLTDEIGKEHTIQGIRIHLELVELTTVVGLRKGAYRGRAFAAGGGSLGHLNLEVISVQGDGQDQAALRFLVSSRVGGKVKVETLPDGRGLVTHRPPGQEP